MSQLVGKFPIFGSRSKLGKLQDTKGKTIPAMFPAFYMNNKLAYEEGFDSLSVEQVNGMFNFLSSALSHLYTNGVPSFTLNLAYPKGAVVSFNGNLYVSLCDDNTTHISQSTHWGKVSLESKPKQVDDFPIGTIMTVPVNTKREGYIDYVEGEKFSATLYPELYSILGSDRFAISNSHAGFDSLPIGSCIHILSADTDVPDGFIEWTNAFGSLRKYPELKQTFTRMVEKLEEGEYKAKWVEALRNDSMPYFEGDFYLGYGQAGKYKTDSVKMTNLVTPPIVIDNSNTLNPMGYSRCVVEQESYPVVVNHQDVSRTMNSNYLVVGQRADVYRADVDKRMYQLNMGDAEQTAPRTLFTRIFVKATKPRPSAISSTHKQIIKAFN